MKLAVIGVGLIGGSFALGLKKAKAVSHVVGVGRNAANLKLAMERGILDSTAPDPASAARDADLVLVAAPVGQYPQIFSSLRETTALITDAGESAARLRQSSPSEPNSPCGKPISAPMRLVSGLRRKPSGRSRMTAPSSSWSAITS